jgi:rare lipoprotein A
MKAPVAIGALYAALISFTAIRMEGQATGLISASPPQSGMGIARMKPLALLLLMSCLIATRPALAEEQVASLPLPPHALTGLASWYGGSHAGKRTASGEIHSTKLLTAANRDLPLGTYVRVTNLKNGRSAVVKVNDRGPYVAGRIIDLSEQAARDLAMLDDGVAPVRVEVLGRD